MDETRDSARHVQPEAVRCCREHSEASQRFRPELASGERPGRIYVVKPVGSIEKDPNLTNKRFRGNPTKSFRSRDALRVTGEITDWQGHSPESIKAMRDGLERLEREGAQIDD